MENKIRKLIYQNYHKNQVNEAGVDVKSLIQRRRPSFLRIIKKWIGDNKNKKIVELGCGYGALLYVLKNMGYENVIGVDTSVDQVEEGAKLFNEKIIIKSEIIDYLNGVKDNSIDIIVAYDVLEHLYKEEIVELLNEVFRVLKKSGAVILHVPNGDGVFCNSVAYADITHETIFTIKSLKQLANISGFHQVSFLEDSPVIHGVISGTRYLLWNILKIPFQLLHLAETGNMAEQLILTRNIYAKFEKNN